MQWYIVLLLALVVIVICTVTLYLFVINRWENKIRSDLLGQLFIGQRIAEVGDVIIIGESAAAAARLDNKTYTILGYNPPEIKEVTGGGTSLAILNTYSMPRLTRETGKRVLSIWGPYYAIIDLEHFSCKTGKFPSPEDNNERR